MIEIRLRVALRYLRRDDLFFLGEAAPPFLVVPARTTLTVVDLFDANALCVTPDGRQILVSRETIRAHGYRPRRYH